MAGGSQVNDRVQADVNFGECCTPFQREVMKKQIPQVATLRAFGYRLTGLRPSIQVE
jgi:hypothetical protein